MRFHIDLIPEEVINKCNLRDKVDKYGWLYCEIRNAIYGLKESGKLANVQLQKVIVKRGYYPCAFTQGLYKHVPCPIMFPLEVDNFGVKYDRKEDADHLEQTIKNSYPIKTDWTGEYDLVMTLKCDYIKIHNNRSVCLSMSGYVRDALIQFQHTYTK